MALSKKIRDELNKAAFRAERPADLRALKQIFMNPKHCHLDIEEHFSDKKAMYRAIEELARSAEPAVFKRLLDTFSLQDEGIAAALRGFKAVEKTHGGEKADPDRAASLEEKREILQLFTAKANHTAQHRPDWGFSER